VSERTSSTSPEAATGAPRALLALAALVGAIGYVLVRCGFGPYPATGIMLDISSRLPTIEPLAPLAQTFQFSPLGPILAWLLGVDGAAAYQALHVLVLVAGAVALSTAIARRWSNDVAVLSAVAFVTSQAALVTVAWTGSYDVFTVLLASTVVVARSRPVVAAAAFVGAFAVFEQLAICLVLLLVVAVVSGDRRRGAYAIGLTAAVAGRVVLTVVLAANDVTYDRRHWLEHFGTSHFLEQFRAAALILVATAFGGAWVIVVVCLRSGVATWRARLVWIAAFAAPLVPAAITEDQTRVYAVITWPLLLALTTSAGTRLAPRRIRATAAGALALGLLVPAVFLWRGDPFLADHHVWRLVIG
jgi:hypothetical protein